MENERERGKGEQRQQFSSVYTKIQTSKPSQTNWTNQPTTHPSSATPTPKLGYKPPDLAGSWLTPMPMQTQKISIELEQRACVRRAFALPYPHFLALSLSLPLHHSPSTSGLAHFVFVLLWKLEDAKYVCSLNIYAEYALPNHPILMGITYVCVCVVGVGRGGGVC